jgi:four helix bundle protein
MKEAAMANVAEGAVRRYDLQDRMLDFTVRLLDVVEALPAGRVGNHMAGQLVRCGTSPVANYSEALSAESRNDFVHKLRTVLKELRETAVWLTLIQRKTLIKPAHRLRPLAVECGELVAIMAASVATAEGKRRGGGRP